ncbi:hypothetical protein [Aliiglaciecola litoralis]|uniref:Uncharacterized protein n=1 Tax=Aliiglaciecola litoralis TaxID=582857 RepID=A0ABP3WMS8_9ALTE
MEIGTTANSAVAQVAAEQQSRQVENNSRQTNLETPSTQPTAQNNPTQDSRVGSVINTQA